MGERRRKKKKKRIVETYQAPHQKRSESDVQTVGWVLISVLDLQDLRRWSGIPTEILGIHTMMAMGYQ